MLNNIKNNYRVFVFQLGCSIGALSLGALLGTSLEFASYKNKVFKNIYIGEIPIGNTSWETAYENVKTHYMADTLNTNLILNLEDTSLEIPLSSLITGANITDVLQTAFDYNENLSLFERYKLLTEKDIKTFPVSFTYDKDAISNFVHHFAELASRDSQDASLSINPNGKIERTADSFGLTIDQSAVTQSIYTLLTPEVCLSTLQNEHAKGKTSVQPLVVDVAPFSSLVTPAITASNLETVDTLVSSFSTSFKPGTGSDVNIAVAAKNINGTLLMPGDTFSYNEILGNTTLDKGYTYATVIVNSQPTKGVGGGVCQVSTTLYNAILHTGIIPTERRPHSRPSTYVPLGLDATIDWGNIDFKFTNTHKYPLYIVSYTASNKVYVDIYSNKDLLSTTYKFQSELLKTVPSPTKYITDASLSKGTTSLVSKGTDGYQVKISRETYTDGTLSETSVLYHDTYAATPTIYKIGT